MQLCFPYMNIYILHFIDKMLKLRTLEPWTLVFIWFFIFWVFYCFKSSKKVDRVIKKKTFSDRFTQRKHVKKVSKKAQSVHGSSILTVKLFQSYDITSTTCYKNNWIQLCFFKANLVTTVQFITAIVTFFNSITKPYSWNAPGTVFTLKPVGRALNVT